MEQNASENLLDVALIPTHAECKAELKKSNDRWKSTGENTQLITAFAEHGPLESFNKCQFHLFKDNAFYDNELLSWATSKGNGPVVKALIGRGVLQAVGSLSFERHVRNALDCLHDDVAVALLRAHPTYKFDPNNDFDQCNLLQVAAYTGSLDCARMLLEGNYGIQVDATTKCLNATPLKLAAERTQNTRGIIYGEPYFTDRKRKMLNLLIAHGANPNIEVVTHRERSMFGSSAEDKTTFIDWCVSNKYDDCLAALVEAKKLWATSKIKAHYYGEETLLEWAYREGSMPLIKAFVPPANDEPRYQSDFSELLITAGARGYKQVIDYVATHPKTQKRKSTAQELVKVAVAKGWDLTTQRLVDHYGKDILFGTDDFYRPMGLLTAAAQSGKLCMVRQLLDFGCDVLEPNAQDKLPLVKSVEVKAGAITDIFLGAGAGTPEAINAALSLAFFRYDTEPKTFEQLLPYASDKCVVRELCSKYTGNTPVEYAAKKGAAMVQAMLEAGFDPHDYREAVPLKIAVQRNDLESVGLLLRYGADPEVAWGGGNTALHGAAFNGSVAMLKLLLDAGISSTKNDEGVTPLMIAVATSGADAVAFLLEESNCSVKDEIVFKELANGENQEISLTLFEFMLKENRNFNRTVCQLLFDRGADIERVNERGETPIFWAMRNGNSAALEWLVAQGARLDVINNKGQTPFSLLASHDRCEQSEMLLAGIKGLSVRSGGLVSVHEALEHRKKWQLDSWPSATEIARWKQSMKFDPFAQIRDFCGADLHKKGDHKPTLDVSIKELESAICQHGVYLFNKKMDELIRSNDLEAIKRFIATGIDLATFDMGHGTTLLHWAAHHGHAELLTDLLENHGLKAVVDKESIHEYSPLAEAKTVECAHILLNHGATVTENVLFKLSYKNNPALCNLAWAHISDELFKTLDIQQLYDCSVSHGNTVVAQKCIERGALPKEEDLVRAVHAQYHEVVTLLVAHHVSLENANQIAKHNRWNPVQSLAKVAVEKKNLPLLKTVVATVDASSIVAAARDGWHEGLEFMLESGLVTCLGLQDDPLGSAIRAESVPCCNLLIKYLQVTFDHINRAVENPAIFALLLTKFQPREGDIDLLLGHAIFKCEPESVKALLCMVKNLSGLDQKKRTYLHAVAKRAHLFGVNEYQGRMGMCWKDRVKNIAWLQAWRIRMLEGKEYVAELEKPGKAIQKAADTLYALMTAPVYTSAEEHKKILFWLLERRCDMTEEGTNWWERYDLQACTAYQWAQKNGNSSTFNDLLDPQKVKQWFAAIDREYAKRDAQQ